MVLAACLGGLACLLALLVIVVGLRHCARASRPPAVQSSGGTEGATGVEKQAETVEALSSGGGQQEQGPSFSSGASTPQEAKPVIKDDVLSAPDSARREDLLRELGSLAKPRWPSDADFDNDPFAVYRVIRDNCEFMTDVLVRAAKYADRQSTHRARIQEIEQLHLRSVTFDGDTAYCTVRIDSSVEANAELSLLLLRCLSGSPDEVVDAMEAQLRSPSQGFYAKRAACVEVAALAWKEILTRIAQTTNRDYRPEAVQRQFEPGAGAMARQTAGFHAYAELLESGSEAVCPGATRQVAQARRAREEARDSRSRFISIAAATESLTQTILLLASSM